MSTLQQSSDNPSSDPAQATAAYFDTRLAEYDRKVAASLRASEQATDKLKKSFNCIVLLVSAIVIGFTIYVFRSATHIAEAERDYQQDLLDAYRSLRIDEQAMATLKATFSGDLDTLRQNVQKTVADVDTELRELRSRAQDVSERLKKAQDVLPQAPKLSQD